MTSKQLPDWVKIGTEMIYPPDRYNGWGKIVKIVKVHKTGRFLVEGDYRQYTPQHDNNGINNRGTRTFYRIHVLTPEVHEKAKASWQLNEARKVVLKYGEGIINLARSNDESAIIAMREKLK
jgi:hypothetical protein